MRKVLKEMISGSIIDDSYTEIIYKDTSYTYIQEIINIFNDYFLKSMVKIFDTILKHDNFDLMVNECGLEETFEVFRTLDYELNIIVFKMPNRTSADDISFKVIKAAYPYITDEITNSVNNSLHTGIIPNRLKIFRATPKRRLLKTNKPEESRPLNIVLEITKIMEKQILESKYQSLYMKVI